MDYQVALGVHGSGIAIDQDEMFAAEVAKEAGGGIDGQAGAGDDHEVGFGDGMDRAGDDSVVQAIIIFKTGTTFSTNGLTALFSSANKRLKISIIFS